MAVVGSNIPSWEGFSDSLCRSARRYSSAPPSQCCSHSSNTSPPFARSFSPLLLVVWAETMTGVKSRRGNGVCQQSPFTCASTAGILMAIATLWIGIPTSLPWTRWLDIEMYHQTILEWWKPNLCREISKSDSFLGSSDDGYIPSSSPGLLDILLLSTFTSPLHS